MAATTANEVVEKHREQQASDSDELLADSDRELFKKGGSIAVTLTATGANVHDLTADGSATVCVYSDAIVIVPGGDGDE